MIAPCPAISIRVLTPTTTIKQRLRRIRTPIFIRKFHRAALSTHQGMPSFHKETLSIPNIRDRIRIHNSILTSRIRTSRTLTNRILIRAITGVKILIRTAAMQIPIRTAKDSRHSRIIAIFPRPLSPASGISFCTTSRVATDTGMEPKRWRGQVFWYFCQCWAVIWFVQCCASKGRRLCRLERDCLKEWYRLYLTN